MQQATEIWLRNQTAVAELRRVGQRLAGAGITAMPLKGVELITYYQHDAAFRSMQDIDILVKPRMFERARELLVTAGYQMLAGGHSVVPFKSPSTGVIVDLHRSPLPPLMGKMTTEYLFSRGKCKRDPAGVIWVHARAEHMLLLLLVNFVKDRFPSEDSHKLAADVGIFQNQVCPKKFEQSARALSLSGAAWLALRGLSGNFAQELVVELKISRTRQLFLDYLQRQVATANLSHPELTYAIVRTVPDQAHYALGSMALCVGRACRDWVWRKRGRRTLAV